MNCRLSAQADSALRRLWDYYFDLGGTRLADRILGEIRDALNRIAEHPTFGHLRPDLTDKPLRFYRVRKLLLIYDPLSSPLYVARIYHGSQDIKTRMQEEQDEPQSD